MVFRTGMNVVQGLDFLIYSVDMEQVSADERVRLKLVEPTFDTIGEIPASDGMYMAVGFPSPGKSIDYSEQRVRIRRELLTGRYDRWDETSQCHRLNLDPVPQAVTTLQGMSGSPVFSLDGTDLAKGSCRLVGMLVTGSLEAMNVGFIDLNRILEFLDCLV